MDHNIALFVGVTSASASEARSYLEQAGGDVENAIASFYAALDEPADAAPAAPAQAAAPASSSNTLSGAAAAPPAAAAAAPAPTPARSADTGGPRTLAGGAAEPLPEGWGGRSLGGTGARVGRVGQWGSTGNSGTSTPRTTGSGPRIGTLGSLGGGGGGGSSRPPAGDDSSDDDEPDLYAGGERSGLNVQNPNRPDRAPGGNDVAREILRKAAKAGAPPSLAGPSSAAPSAPPSWGRGHTLGADATAEDEMDAEDDDADEQEDDEEVVVRHLTFWREGFSIEDGELRRYDDPTSKAVLDAINNGTAPPSILNVRIGQAVEVRVSKRLGEDYVPPPPPPRGPFEGSGNRLGAPVSAVTSSSSSSSTAVPGAFPSSTAPAPAAGAAAVETKPAAFTVDPSQPTTSVQIRLGDGTRLVARVNLTHTVGDIRGFINASRPASAARPYALQMTFPNKDLADEGQTVADGKLENAVVVQRWV